MDLKTIKEHFPIFNQYDNLIYLDSAATTQRPEQVLKVQNRIYKTLNANAHRSEYGLAQKATALIDDIREQVARFINAKDAKEIIFTKNTTESLNNVSRGLGLISGDEIITTRMEHHSNFLPWKMLAEKNDLKLTICSYDADTGIDHLVDLVSEKTKVVSFSAMSNVTGKISAIKNIVKKIREKNSECIIILDACQYIAHYPLDVQDLDIDFVAFSMHKLFGPFGVGILYGKESRLASLEPSVFGGGMVTTVSDEYVEWNSIPERFEAGTQDIASIGASGEAIRFLEELSYTKLIEYESSLREYTCKTLRAIPDIEIIGHTDNSYGPVISFSVKGVSSFDISSFCAAENICVRAGKHCAHPLCESLEVSSVTRVSLSIYNSEKDIDALVSCIEKAITVFRR